MLMKKIIPLFLLLLSHAGISAASTVGFDPAASNVMLNDSFTVDIVGNDFPITQGGGLNLAFDQSIVNVLSVSIDNTVWNFVNSAGSIDNTLGQVSNILVTTFPGVQGGGFVVASLELQAVGVGVSSLLVSDSTIDNPWGSDGQRVNRPVPSPSGGANALE